MAVDEVSPFPQARDHPIHGGRAESLGLIDALPQPENAPLGSECFERCLRRKLSDEKPAGQSPDVDSG